MESIVNNNIENDAAKFLTFVQELSSKLPPKAIHDVKSKTQFEDESNSESSFSDDSRDSGIEKEEIKSMTINENVIENSRFECTICNKHFKRRSSLSTHRLIHLNVKPFTCTVCSKEFLRRSDLKKHSLMHTGKKPHECPICKKQFSQSSNMLTHMRRHTGIRPYSCHICGNSFYRKVDVRRHQSRHQREKLLEKLEDDVLKTS